MMRYLPLLAILSAWLLGISGRWPLALAQPSAVPIDLLTKKNYAVLALDADAVYWMDISGLRRLPFAGKQAELLQPHSGRWSPFAPRSLAVDDKAVYWVSDSHLWKAAKTQGARPEPLAEVFGEVPAIIAADCIYFVTTGSGKEYSQSGAKSGGGEVNAIDSQGHKVVLARNLRPSLVGLSLIGSTLYAASDQGGIYKIPTGGKGRPFRVANMPGLVTAITSDTSSMYVASNGTLYRSELASAKSTAVQLPGRATEIALDETYVYGTMFENPAMLVRIPRTGGPAETMVTGLSYPMKLAVGGDYVFVASWGRILRVQKQRTYLTPLDASKLPGAAENAPTPLDVSQLPRAVEKVP